MLEMKKLDELKLQLDIFFCYLMWFFTWSSALLFFFGLAMTISTYLFVNHAVHAKAVIVDNYDRDLSAVPTYTFEDQQGKVHQITSSTGYNPPLGKPGDKIDILYDPDEPETAEENNFRALWALAIFSLAGGFTNFLTLGAVYLYAKRRLKNRAQDAPQ